MLKKLFILAVFAIPFSDFWGLLPLGEMAHELSAYIFLVTIGLVCATYFKGRKTGEAPPRALTNYYFLPKMAAIMLGIIFFSFMMNFPAMFGSEFRGRLPIAKFTTSTMVVFYGIALAYLSYNFGDRYSWHELVMKPVSMSVGLCMAVALIEMAAWTNGGAEVIYRLISKVVHAYYFSAAETSSGDWTETSSFVGRARAVCFEPPALANFAGFAWPWVFGAYQAAARKNKVGYFIMLVMCTALIIVANSRTSYVLLIGNIVTWALLRYVYLPPRPQQAQVHRAVSLVLVTFTILLIGTFILDYGALETAVVESDNVSNITRFSSITAAFKMFLDRPAWGYGFGQYGFHILEYLPAWAYHSWEVRVWFEGATFGGVWPPVFSIFARFAAELGIMGLLGWAGLWIWLARSVWRVTVAYQRATGNLLIFSYPLILSCYTALLSGLALDSLRSPMLWISLGLSCCFIADVKGRLSALQRPSKVNVSDKPAIAV